METLAKTPLQILDANKGMANTNPANNVTYPTPPMQINPYPQWTGQGINPNIETQSTTTLSSDKTKDIINNNLNFQNLSKKGITTDPNTGIAKYADDSVYQEPDTTVEDDEISQNLQQMRTNTDAVTAASIAGIQDKYRRLKAEQEKINQSTLAGTTNALITSGAAQHDVFSNDAIKLRMEQNLGKIQELEDEEMSLINTAKAAQASQQNEILEKANIQLNKKREEKIKATEALNKDLLEATKKAREKKVQAEQDNAISSLYSQGITDVPTIASQLKESGYDISVKDIADTIKNIVPAGLDDLVKTLRTNGAPQDVIQKVLSSSDINSAYQNAGSWGAGGTGIVGEYNLYKAQAEAKGQVPVDFNAYQDIDANRKKSIAAAGIANEYGLDKEQRTRVAGLLDDYDKQAKDKKTVLSQSAQIDALSELALSSNKDKGSRAAAQIGTIFSFMKMLDPSSTVREGEYATAQNTAGVSDQIRNAYNKVKDGSFLTDTQIKGYVSTAKAVAESNRRQLEDIDKEFDRRSKIFGIPSGVISKEAATTTTETLVKTGTEAKTAVDKIFDSLPSEVQSMIISSYDANLDDLTIYNQLKNKGFIK